jgi:hypothetical protein
MYIEDIGIELYEVFELINYTLSNKFIENWESKYSAKFLSAFQVKLIDSLAVKKKPLTSNDMFKYLQKKCKYSPFQIRNFFESIDISSYAPIIQESVYGVL